MKDFDVESGFARCSAKKAAETPLVSSILQISSTTEVLPLTLSDEVAARLLDIAILCGNTKAAANLAKSCPVRPLRRWNGENLVCFSDMLRPALLAGADFHNLHTTCVNHGMIILDRFDVEIAAPLLMSLALDPKYWQQPELRPFLGSKQWWPIRDKELAGMFLERGGISLEKVQKGLLSGWNLKYICNTIYEPNATVEAGLLDLAILNGQSDCAEALATAGVELREGCLDLLQRAFRGDPEVVFQAASSDCKSAASAAARAFLTRTFKSEGVEKGIPLYQVLRKFKVPKAIVHDILAYSMKAPKILDQLDLWDDVSKWADPQ